MTHHGLSERRPARWCSLVRLDDSHFPFSPFPASNSCLLKLMWSDFLTANDTTLGALPFAHSYGQVILMSHCPFVGCPVVVLPKFDSTA